MVEYRHLAVVRQRELIAMQKVIALLKRSRRSARPYAKEARIELLCQLTNGATFARSIPPFQADDRANIRHLSCILQLAQPLLKFRHRLLVCRLRETLLEIDAFEQFPKPLTNNWRSVLAHLEAVQIQSADLLIQRVSRYRRIGIPRSERPKDRRKRIHPARPFHRLRSRLACGT